MRNRATALLILVLLVASGCMRAPADETDPSPARATWEPSVVHKSGEIVAASGFPAEPPIMKEFLMPGFRAFEPTLGLDLEGNLFYLALDEEAPRAAGIAPPQVLRSRDGMNWTEVSPRIAGMHEHAYNGDPYLRVDPDTGRVFVATTHGCLTLSWSDDVGETWTTNQAVCQPPISDHQTLFVGPPAAGTTTRGYPNVLYVCSNQFALSFTIMCSRTLDGGLTFEPARVVKVEPAGDVRFVQPTPCGGNAHGPGRVSMLDGSVYLPRVYCNEARLHISRDSGLTWSEVFVDRTQGGTPDFTDNHEGTIAIDSAGHIYYVWMARDRLPRLSVSQDRGETWSPPIAIGLPGLPAAKFPVVTAGDPGRIAILYYGTHNVTEGTPDSDASWNAYVGFSLNALDESPVFATATLNPPGDPVVHSACGEFCDGVGDFLDLVTDPVTGYVWASLVDTCVDACGPAPEQPSPGHAAIGIQLEGPSLFAN